MNWYVDTSAALKLVIEEDESTALADWLDQLDDTVVSSMLLWTELHCAAGRRAEIDPTTVRDVLDGLTLVDLRRDDLIRAGTSAWGLRSADSIHLAVAVRLQVDGLVAYDHELLAAAERIGLTTAHPGVS